MIILLTKIKNVRFLVSLNLVLCQGWDFPIKATFVQALKSVPCHLAKTCNFFFRFLYKNSPLVPRHDVFIRFNHQKIQREILVYSISSIKSCRQCFRARFCGLRVSVTHSLVYFCNFTLIFLDPFDWLSTSNCVVWGAKMAIPKSEKKVIDIMKADEMWKTSIRSEDASAKNWQTNWGWILDEYRYSLSWTKDRVFHGDLQMFGEETQGEKCRVQVSDAHSGREETRATKTDRLSRNHQPRVWLDCFAAKFPARTFWGWHFRTSTLAWFLPYSQTLTDKNCVKNHLSHDIASKFFRMKISPYAFQPILHANWLWRARFLIAISIKARDDVPFCCFWHVQRQSALWELLLPSNVIMLTCHFFLA